MHRSSICWYPLIAVVLSLSLNGCSRVEPVFHEGSPALLSQWSLLIRSGNTLEPVSRVHPYFLNSALFTDYAHKLRTVTVPRGTSATVNEEGVLQFPVGTVISKTFFYPQQGGTLQKVTDRGQMVAADGSLDLTKVRLIETRLLVRRDSGWQALPYVWNDSQTDATLEITGDIQQLTLVEGNTRTPFNYLVPDQNQCAGCHETDTNSDGISPIGPKLANLNAGPADIRPDQLEQFVKDGWLSLRNYQGALTTLVNWQNPSASLEDRARAYLDVNCGHCHSDKGPADTSGLFLTSAEQNATRLGTCKLPIAAGQGTGGHEFSIVPGEADASIMVYRMNSSDPGAMMPELGRSLVHQEGVTLIADWINAMPGSCNGS